MTAEQEAIERLREASAIIDKSTIYTSLQVKNADLRALLDSHERMRLALEGNVGLMREMHFHQYGWEDCEDVEGLHAPSSLCVVSTEARAALEGNQ